MSIAGHHDVDDGLEDLLLDSQGDVNDLLDGHHVVDLALEDKRSET